MQREVCQVLVVRHVGSCCDTGMGQGHQTGGSHGCSVVRNEWACLSLAQAHVCKGVMVHNSRARLGA